MKLMAGMEIVDNSRAYHVSFSGYFMFMIKVFSNFEDAVGPVHI